MGRETRIIVTGDGSHSLYLPEMNETYHSSHGALTESKHVFIAAGLEHFQQKCEASSTSVLEIGFGTGLNALLAYEFAKLHKLSVHFTSLEPFPLNSEIYQQLNYGADMPEASKTAFLNMHEAVWDADVEMSEFFTLHKAKTRLENFESTKSFDVVFYDAFAPSKQAELWGYEILQKTVGFMAANAVLVTYCAKGQFKRDLAALGLNVETLPGPPGKKEMVRATTA